MKKVLMVLLMLVIPAQVFAGDNVYIKGNIGLFLTENSDINAGDETGDFHLGANTTVPGFNLGAAIGRSWGNFDTEIEYSYMETNYKKFKGNTLEDEEGNALVGEDGETVTIPDEDLDNSMNIKTLMANGIFNAKNSSIFTPYIGAGVGFGWIQGVGYQSGFENTKLAYQLLAGVDASLTKNTSILVGYRYLGMGDISRDTIYLDQDVDGNDVLLAVEENVSVDAHIINIGLKYSF